MAAFKGWDEPEKAVGWLVPSPLQWAPQISDPAGWQKEFADHRVGQNPVSSIFPITPQHFTRFAFVDLA